MPGESRRDVLVGAGGVILATGAAASASGNAAPSTAGGLVGAGPARMWTNHESTRWAWLPLRMTDVRSDPAALVNDAERFNVNVLVLTVAGLSAFYPSKVQYHPVSPYMPPGRDFFGEVTRLALARGMRVCGRVDFSRAPREAFRDHPEWFFKRPNGNPVSDETNRYQPCINGGWYRGHAITIMKEVLDRYTLSAMFFNNFVNNPRNWRLNEPCQCAECQSRHMAKFGRPVPAAVNPEYDAFIDDCVSATGALYRDAMAAAQPGCLYLNDTEPTDGSHTESRAASYPGQLWPYAAGVSVNRQRNSEPEKTGFNIVIGYGANQRLAVLPPHQVQNQLYQAMAHGSFPVFALTGTFVQEDRAGGEAARQVFAWHKANEDVYLGQRSAARVLLLLGPRSRDFALAVTPAEQTQRGLVRILAEKHIPFAMSENDNALRADPRAFDLVIVAPGATADVEPYIRGGGRVIFAGDPPKYGLPQPVKEWPPLQSAYFRIQDRNLFPSTALTNVAVAQGRFLEFPPEAQPLLTLMPPHLEEMAETAQLDMVETNKPGLLLRQHGAGRFAYLPWDVAGIYYRQSFPVHSDIVSDLIDHMLPNGRQLHTNAHPLVETALMRQDSRGRHLLHLVNATGQAQVHYAPPLPIRDVEVRVAGGFTAAQSRALGRALPVQKSGAYSRFVIPEVKTYDVVVLT